MNYKIGNILNYIGRPDVIAITTNGFLRACGVGVMGRGIAFQMAAQYPELPTLLGKALRTKGNIVTPLLEVEGTTLVSFPVKPSRIVLNNPNEVVTHARNKYRIGELVPGFHCVADLDIISASCLQLVDYMEQNNHRHAVIPIPGCGAGELSYNKSGVRRVCEATLPDNVWMMSYQAKDFQN